MERANWYFGFGPLPLNISVLAFLSPLRLDHFYDQSFKPEVLSKKMQNFLLQKLLTWEHEPSRLLIKLALSILRCLRVITCVLNILSSVFILSFCSIKNISEHFGLFGLLIAPLPPVNLLPLKRASALVNHTVNFAVAKDIAQLNHAAAIEWAENVRVLVILGMKSATIILKSSFEVIFSNWSFRMHIFRTTYWV